MQQADAVLPSHRRVSKGYSIYRVSTIDVFLDPSEETDFTAIFVAK